jgi:hypothetical protein
VRGGYLRAERKRRHHVTEEHPMINDPYLALDLHRAHVEALTADIRSSRLRRALRRNASSTAATDRVADPVAEDRVPARRALRRRPA